jgi:hypothetical protein
MRHRKSKSKTRKNRKTRRGGATNPLLEQESAKVIEQKAVDNQRIIAQGYLDKYNKYYAFWKTLELKRNQFLRLQKHFEDWGDDSGSANAEYPLSDILKRLDLVTEDFTTYFDQKKYQDKGNPEMIFSVIEDPDTGLSKDKFTVEMNKINNIIREYKQRYNKELFEYKDLVKQYEDKYNPKPVIQAPRQAPPKKSVLGTMRRGIGSLFGR